MPLNLCAVRYVKVSLNFIKLIRAQEKQRGREAAEELPLLGREQTDVLRLRVLLQLHGDRQREAPESDQYHTEDRRRSQPLPEGQLHLLLPQQSSEHCQRQHTPWVTPI